MRNCILAAFATVALVTPASGQSVPDDLTKIPPITTDFEPPRTPWGDPDMRGTWPIENIDQMDLPIEREEELGNRAWLTDEEYAERLAAARESDGSFEEELRTRGTIGLSSWLESTDMGRRNSMLVDPPNGRFPPLTEAAQPLQEAGRSSWVNGQSRDWITDLDIYDRCVTRGFPASMFPFPYNNGIRIFQAPGMVVIHHEMMSTRVVPLGPTERWPEDVRTYMGQPIGYWEGNTLVIETTNIIDGDATDPDIHRRAASPNAWDTTYPTSAEARVVERLTMLSPERIIYEITYTDPLVYTAPWTARYDWTRNDGYEMYEFACHEGNVQVRDMINSSRGQRSRDAEAAAETAAEAAAGG